MRKLNKWACLIGEVVWCVNSLGPRGNCTVHDEWSAWFVRYNNSTGDERAKGKSGNKLFFVLFLFIGRDELHAKKWFFFTSSELLLVWLILFLV